MQKGDEIQMEVEEQYLIWSERLLSKRKEKRDTYNSVKAGNFQLFTSSDTLHASNFIQAWILIFSQHMLDGMTLLGEITHFFLSHISISFKCCVSLSSFDGKLPSLSKSRRLLQKKESYRVSTAGHHRQSRKTREILAEKSR